MKTGLTIALVLSSLLAGQAFATESGVPPAMPSGATVGVPVGASPPPGFYFGSLNAYFTGDVYSGDSKLAIQKSIAVTVQQFQWVSDFKILGGTYSAMATVPWAYVNQNTFGSKADRGGLGDITITPMQLSWSVAPGIFVSSGLGFTLPTGHFSTQNNAVNMGTNTFTTTVSSGFSYLRDGWNISSDFNYFFHTTNKTTNYRSGDEFLINWTVMKDLGPFSIGPVGYWRKQVQEDVNNGSFYGGVANGRAEQVAIGFGISKQFGPVTASLNYTHDIRRQNTLSGDTVFLNFRMPLRLP
jgi:hypothetical protein